MDRCILFSTENFLFVAKNSKLTANIRMTECFISLQFRTERLKKSFSSELRSEYLSCLKNFSSLISNSTSDSMQRGLLETLEDEIKRVKGEL